jgi:hypothetical protein
MYVFFVYGLDWKGADDDAGLSHSCSSLSRPSTFVASGRRRGLKSGPSIRLV